MTPPPSFAATEVVIHPDVEEVYSEIERRAADGRQPEQAIWNSLRRAFARARASAQFADPIPRIPRHFSNKYGATNLYCCDLASFRRAFYTIRGRRVIFLDLIDHAQYDRWFPNKGK